MFALQATKLQLIAPYPILNVVSYLNKAANFCHLSTQLKCQIVTVAVWHEGRQVSVICHSWNSSRLIAAAAQSTYSALLLLRCLIFQICSSLSLFLQHAILIRWKSINDRSLHPKTYLFSFYEIYSTAISPRHIW